MTGKFRQVRMKYRRMLFRTIGAVVGLLAGAASLWGQFTPGGVDFPDNYSADPQQEDFEAIPDTADIFYFFADNPQEEFSFADSLLGDHFQQLDPARQRDLDYANLGNVGSAYRPIVYEPVYRKGFDMGLHQFDLYQVLAPRLPFYRIDRAFTNLAYYQRAEQGDSYFTGQFSRNFSDGFNFSIDYRRINMLGTRNQFPNQRTRNTAVATGLWYHSPGGRYDGFLSASWNTIEQEDNGGIRVTPEANDGISTPASAQVFLNEARTRHRHNGFSYTHYYTFGKATAPLPAAPPVRRRPPGLGPGAVADSLQQVDSLRRPLADTMAAPPSSAGPRPLVNRRRFTLAHNLFFRNNSYKFHDADVDSEAAADYYGDFLVDARGIRFYAEERMLENTFRLRTYKLGATGGKGARRQRDLLEVGVMNRLTWLDLEAADSTVNNLFLQGRLHFQPGDRLRIRTYGHFGLLENAGDYRVFGELFFGLGKFGELSATVNNQLYEPNLIQSRFFVSQRDVWGHDFRKTLETNISATYALPQWRLEVTGAYHLLNNYIYFDSLAMPQQTGVPISLLQLIVKKDITIGKIHLDNAVAFQTSSEDFIRVPEIFSKHSLYYQGFWFRVLHVRFGFDLRMNTAYQPYYYHPLVGQFILQDRQTTEFYPAIDAFLSLRVTRFRAFFKWENMTNLFIDESENLYYLNAFYPMQTGPGFRFGIKWRFLD